MPGGVYSVVAAMRSGLLSVQIISETAKARHNRPVFENQHIGFVGISISVFDAVVASDYSFSSSSSAHTSSSTQRMASMITSGSVSIM